MIFENTSITGIENAIKGMRLPMCRNLQEVERKSDTRFNKIGNKVEIGVETKEEKK